MASFDDCSRIALDQRSTALLDPRTRGKREGDSQAAIAGSTSSGSAKRVRPHRSERVIGTPAPDVSCTAAGEDRRMEQQHCSSRSPRFRQYLEREATMKAPLLLAGAVIIGSMAPALADEYYVVQGPSHRCTITTTRPADREIVTQIGPMAFTSRVEAEDRIKQTKVCEDEGTVGSSTSTTTIIKEK